MLLTLKFINDIVDEVSDAPNVLYRSFSCKTDAENFLDGNIWFSGTNRTRYLVCNNRSDSEECRIFEEYNENNLQVKTSLDEFDLADHTLSFSSSLIEANNNVVVKIRNPSEFTKILIKGIRNDNKMKFFWFKDIEKIGSHAKFDSTGFDKKNNNYSTLNLLLFRIFSRKVILFTS